MTNFIVRFPLKTEKYQEDILDKRFEIGRQIYNSLVNLTLCSSKAKQFYGRFYNKLHNLEVERLTGHKNLSSIGI